MSQAATGESMPPDSNTIERPLEPKGKPTPGRFLAREDQDVFLQDQDVHDEFGLRHLSRQPGGGENGGAHQAADLG